MRVQVGEGTNETEHMSIEESIALMEEHTGGLEQKRVM